MGWGRTAVGPNGVDPLPRGPLTWIVVVVVLVTVAALNVVSHGSDKSSHDALDRYLRGLQQDDPAAVLAVTCPAERGKLPPVGDAAGWRRLLAMEQLRLGGTVTSFDVTRPGSDEAVVHLSVSPDGRSVDTQGMTVVFGIRTRGPRAQVCPEGTNVYGEIG